MLNQILNLLPLAWRCQKGVNQVGVYDPNTQIKCLFEAFISGICKKQHINIFPDEISALTVT